MKAEFEITDDILIVKLSGEVDHHGTAKIRDEIDSTYRVFGSRHMILDFSAVSFIDSSGIGMIMGRYNKVQETGGRMQICGCSEYMRSIILMSGIFTIVRECGSVQEGIRLLRNDEEESVAGTEKEEKSETIGGMQHEK